jgi:hypothetical protein
MTASTNPVRRIDITISLRPELEMAQSDIIDKFYDFAARHTDMFVFQLEKTGLDNLHIQGRVNIKARTRTLAFAKKTASEMKIDLKYINCSPTSNPTQNFDYTMKSETRVEGPWSNRDLSSFKVEDPLKGQEFYPWQEWILNQWFDKNKKALYNPNGRKILFVVDEKGNTGKSSLCKHCAIQRQKDVCILPVSGSPSQLSSAIIDAGPFPNYILDLPRCKPHNYRDWIQDILHVIEQLQNGLIVNSMYGKYKNLVMNNPQIVIFSNWYIDQKLSSDRYYYMDKNIGSPEDEFADENGFVEVYESPRGTREFFPVPNGPGHLINKEGECDNDLSPSRIGAQDVNL